MVAAVVHTVLDSVVTLAVTVVTVVVDSVVPVNVLLAVAVVTVVVNGVVPVSAALVSSRSGAKLTFLASSPRAISPLNATEASSLE